MQARKAASVLPDPVGAEISVVWPARMWGQPCSCGSIGVEPCERLSNALGKRGGGAVAGNKALNLGIIEDHAYGLIAYQCPLLIGQARGNEVGWNVHQLRFHADGGADDAK